METKSIRFVYHILHFCGEPNKMSKLYEKAWTVCVLYFLAGAPQKSDSVNIMPTLLNHHKGRYKGSSRGEKELRGKRNTKRGGGWWMVVHRQQRRGG